MSALAKALGVLAVLGSILLVISAIFYVGQLLTTPLLSNNSGLGYVIGYLAAMALVILLALWLGRWGVRYLRR